MKDIYRKPVFWLFGVAIVTAGSGFAMMNIFNPTNIAETGFDSEDSALRSRRYRLKGDLQTTRRETEAIIPTIKTAIWGGNWQLAASQNADSSNNDAAIIYVVVPVVFFTDDLQIFLKRDGDEIIVNVRSSSRVGKSDFGENQRHLLQILAKLDERFGSS